MNGLSNIFEASEVWTDDDFNLFLNIQTPIHKKKDDLLFPHLDDLESQGLSDLSISPLVPIRGGKQLPSTLINHSPPSVSNSSNNRLKSAPSQEVIRNSTNCKINKNETKACPQQPIVNSRELAQQEINSKITPTITLTKSQNDENTKPHQNSKPIPSNECKPSKQLRINEPQITKKPKYPPKKPKHSKQAPLESSGKNLSVPSQIMPTKQAHREKLTLPSPIPQLFNKKNQNIPQPSNPPSKPSLSQQVSSKPPIPQKPPKQPIKSEDINVPPPLPNLPPQQLILKLFEEKQKRFFKRLEDDSLVLIDFISNYSVL